MRPVLRRGQALRRPAPPSLYPGFLRFHQGFSSLDDGFVPLRLEVKAKRPEAEGFEPIPSRGRVERTSARPARRRRLSEGDEEPTDSAEAFVKRAMIHRMARLSPSMAARR